MKEGWKIIKKKLSNTNSNKNISFNDIANTQVSIKNNKKKDYSKVSLS